MQTCYHHTEPGLQYGCKKNAKTFFQPKLSFSSPADVYEQEADAVADKVMRMSANLSGTETFFPVANNFIQRKCAHCEEEEKKIHKKENSASIIQETSGGAEFENYVSGLNNSGTPFSKETRNFFEERMGYDFSNVKIHKDPVAAKSAQSINALAYTSGNNIVFNNGQYSPESVSGKKLLAHELTHVVQQNPSNAVYRRTDPVIPEKEKEEMTAKDYRESTRYQCSDSEMDKIKLASAKAKEWLSIALSKLEDYIRNPEDDKMRAALSFYFHAADEATAIQVASVLDHINKNMIPNSAISIYCGYDDGNICDRITIAANLGSSIYFCPLFLNALTVGNDDIATIIHEAAHTMYKGYFPANENASNSTVIDDRAYYHFRKYKFLSTKETLTNADSYSTFCYSVFTGNYPEVKIAADEYNYCDGGQINILEKDVAVIQEINADFISRAQDTREIWWDSWETLRYMIFGGGDAEHIAPALNAAMNLHKYLGTKNFNFNCLKKCPEIGYNFTDHTDMVNYQFSYKDTIYYTHVSNDYIICSQYFDISYDDRIIKLYECLLVNQGGLPKFKYSGIGYLAFKVFKKDFYIPGDSYTPDEAMDKMNLPPKKLPPVF